MTAHVASITRVEEVETIQSRRTELHVALGRAILKDPSILDEMPNSAVVALLPSDADEAFIDAEVSLGIDALKKGRSVYFKRLAPGEWGIDGERPNAE
jgi:hypothetical protein